MVDQHRDLRLIDRALAKVKANPTDAALRAETARRRPAVRRITVRVKQTELLGTTLADGGFSLPTMVAPVESLSG